MTYLEQLKEELSPDQYLLVEIVIKEAEMKVLRESLKVVSNNK